MVNNKQIISALGNVTVDTSSIKNDTVDKDVVDFYVNRFTMCLADNCPAAVQAYLEKMQKDSAINGLTKLEILRAHFQLTTKED